MIRPKQQESKASIKPVSEMSPQGTSIYINTAKTLQNYLTNCIISKRSLEFYLKKTFENDQALSEYNFYKEIDPIKLKIIIETMLKNIKSEYRNDPRGGSPNRRGDANSTELAEDYKQRLRSYLGQINSMVNSIKATKKAEFNLFKYILKEVLPTIKSDQIKNDIQFIIQENANLEGILDTVNRETEQFNQELAAASFADFNITQESAPSKSPEREMTIQEDDAPQQKTISKKMSKVMDDQKTESKNDPFENKDRRELNEYIY